MTDRVSSLQRLVERASRCRNLTSWSCFELAGAFGHDRNKLPEQGFKPENVVSSLVGNVKSRSRSNGLRSCKPETKSRKSLPASELRYRYEHTATNDNELRNYLGNRLDEHVIPRRPGKYSE